jgi:hypothetical protein
MKKSSILALIISVAALVMALSVTASSPAATAPGAQPGSSLVAICQGVPCPDAQEFTVSDDNGAPIFSVGEYGGAGVFGDCLSTYANVFYAATTECPWAPLAYDARLGLPRSCVGPHVWLSPSGIWACHGGAWRLKLKL